MVLVGIAHKTGFLVIKNSLEFFVFDIVTVVLG
jgi:hypothetical protein